MRRSRSRASEGLLWKEDPVKEGARTHDLIATEPVDLRDRIA
jgi:hypothetical protein